MMKKLTGSDALISTLINEGVEVIFGVPGEHVMYMVDSFSRQSSIRWITTRQEQTAVYMAFGYAKKGKQVWRLLCPDQGL